MTKYNCPCGQKKRYQACCLLKRMPTYSSSALGFQRLQTAYEQLWQTYLIPYIEARTPTVIAMAWEDCLPKTWPRAINREYLLRDFFNDWLAFSWLPYDRDGDKTLHIAETLAAQCYAQTGEDWPRPVEQCFQAICEGYYSVYRVLACEVGGLTVEDLLLGETVTVQPYLPLPSVYPETLLVGRLIRWEGSAYLLTSMPYHLPIDASCFMKGWTDWCVEEAVLPRTVEQLQEESSIYGLIGYYLSILRTLYHRDEAVMTNAQGELIVPMQSQFQLTCSLYATLERILPVLHRQSAFLTLPKDDITTLTKVVIPWYQEQTDRYLGRLLLTPTSLVLETESKERSEVGQALLQQCLKDGALLKKVVKQEVPQLLVNG